MMGNRAGNKAILWLRVSYRVGALADGVMAVAMLYPPMLRTLLGFSDADVNVATRSALAMGASLMAGWTLLLLWADRKPVERSGVLLLTVFPVITGLALTTAYGAWVGFNPIGRAIAILLFQLFLVVLFSASYVHARRAQRREERPGGQATEQYERYVAWKFGGLAKCYDLFDLAFVFAGKSNPRHALARKIPNRPLRILDVCVGTANAAIAVARTNAQNQIVGIDLSPDMLAVAANKVQRHNIRNLSLRQMNARQMDFGDGEFDVAMISFGLHEMDHDLMMGVLSEMARVVTPGGSLFIVDYERPKLIVISSLFSLFLWLFEPAHLRAFLKYDWGEILHSVGLELSTIQRCRFSKLIAATK